MAIIHQELTNAEAWAGYDARNTYGEDYRYLDSMAKIKTVESDAYRTEGDIGEAEKAAKEAASYRSSAEDALNRETAGALPVDPLTVIAALAAAAAIPIFRPRN